MALEESEYIIVTETPDISLSLTPTAVPPTPVDTPTPTATATLIPTVTRNPNFEDQENVTPQAKNSELIMGYSIEWDNADGRAFQATYFGQINLVAKGGVPGDYTFFSEEEELSEGVIEIAIDNCENQFYKVSVRSGDLDPVYRDVTVTAPCIGG